MKTKSILRFYFWADSLNKAFDNLIIHNACATDKDGLAAAEKLCSVIGEKICLERLWAYLDGVLSAFSMEERQTLFRYSARYPAVRGDAEQRVVRKTVIKFTRRARRLAELGEDIAVLKKYFCLITA